MSMNMGIWNTVQRALLAALLTIGLGAPVLAFDDLRIDELSYLDKQYMSAQRSSLEELVRTNFGGRFNGHRNHDLALLQRLLDERLVRNDQIRELQAMGIVMGDLLAAELDMHWVVYEDKVGRTRALRYQESDVYLFPATMISRRRQADNRTPVQQIYQKAVDTIANSRPQQPFQ